MDTIVELTGNEQWQAGPHGSAIGDEPGDATGFAITGPDSVAQYLRHIGRVPLLSAADEYALCAQIEAAQQALAAALFLIPDAARQIAMRARHRHGPGDQADDILQNGDGHALTTGQRRTAVAAIARAQRLGAALARAPGGEPRSGRRHGRSARLRVSLAATVMTIPLRFSTIETIASGVPAVPGDPAAADVCAQLARVRRLKQRLVEANLRLVVAVAKRYSHSDVPLPDRIQDGNLGLLKAVDRFQFRRGFRFSTYAIWWIRQAVSRGIVETERTVRLPSHLVATLSRITAARRTLGRDLGREPTEPEIASRTHLPVDKVAFALRSSAPILSLDTPVVDGTVLRDLLPDAGASAPDGPVLAVDMLTRAVAALDALRPRDRVILGLRFGIGHEREHTLQEIACELGISRERVRQLVAAALKRLQRRLSEPARAAA
jgi:RNA polymerase sigma factor (sigma-70 family)